MQLPSTRSTCYHEAAHAASLILNGWPPKVVRVDMPRGLLGSCKVDWDARDPSDTGTLRLALISVLCGPMSDGENVTQWYPDAWPENRDGQQAKYLSEELGLDEVAWGFVCYKAARQCRDRHFRTLQVAIAQRLEDVEIVGQAELIAMAKDIHD